MQRLHFGRTATAVVLMSMTHCVTAIHITHCIS